MSSPSPGLVLAAFVESIVEGRRVVVFGDATSGIAEELLDRGARSVHHYDPVAARAAEAAGRTRSQKLTFLALDDADLAVRDGAFDVALVADLALAADPSVLLRRVRRALSTRGACVVASPNPEVRSPLAAPRPGGGAPSYYELFDRVTAEFPDARMLGQAPFVGYAVVEFAPDRDVELSLDSSLVPGGAEEPEWFLAVAGPLSRDLEAFSLVQLPSADLLAARSAPGPRTGSEKPGAAAPSNDGSAEALREAETRAEGAVQRAVAAEARAAAAEARLEAETRASREADARADAAEARAAQAETRLASALRAAEAAEARAAQTETRLASALRAAEAAEARAAQTETRLASAARSAQDAEARAAQTETRLASALRAAEAAEARGNRAETTAREAGARDQGAVREVREALEAAESRAARAELQVQAARAEIEILRERHAADEDAHGRARQREHDALVADRDRKAAELQTLTARATRAEAELLDARAALEAKAAELAALQAKAAELAALQAKAAELAALQARAGGEPDDLDVLEAALRARGALVRALQSELREAERIGRELVLARAPARPEAPRNGTTDLETENARLRADLEALGWARARAARTAEDRAQAR